MEPVPDASVLAQLEARAHRMGQRRPVEVEVLAIEGCAAEEAMLATVDPELAQRLAAAAAARSGDDAADNRLAMRRTSGCAGGQSAAHSRLGGKEETVDAERARHKQCLALVRAVSVLP
jgi:hypothetical protein